MRHTTTALLNRGKLKFIQILIRNPQLRDIFQTFKDLDAIPGGSNRCGKILSYCFVWLWWDGRTLLFVVTIAIRT